MAASGASRCGRDHRIRERPAVHPVLDLPPALLDVPVEVLVEPLQALRGPILGEPLRQPLAWADAGGVGPEQPLTDLVGYLAEEGHGHCDGGQMVDPPRLRLTGLVLREGQ